MALGKNLKTGKKKEEPQKGSVKAEAKKAKKEEKKAPDNKKDPVKTVPAAKPENKKEPAVAKAESKKEIKPIDLPKADIKETKPTVADLNKELETERQLDEHTRMLVVFAVGDEEYAFDIDQIKEVVPVPSISKVPQTKNYIKGVANVRGNVLAVIDLALKFALHKTDQKDYVKYVIVIKSEDIKVAVASGQVPETLMVSDSQMDSTADVVRKSQNEQGFIKGVIKKDKRMIICIDILEMLENEQHVNV